MPVDVRFPSFEFLEALQDQVNENASTFDSLDPADAYFAVGIGDHAFAVEIEGQECVGLGRGVNPNDVDFILAGSDEAWTELLENIIENNGADSSHQIQALVDDGSGLRIDGSDDAALEAFRAHAAWIQAFLDLAKNLEIEFT
jgi:hypothetical protein